MVDAVSFNRNLSSRTIRYMNATWNTLDRSPGLYCDEIADKAIETAGEIYNEGLHRYYSGSGVSKFQGKLCHLHSYALGHGLWGKDKDKHSMHFLDLSDDMRLNYDVLELAAIIAYNSENPPEHPLKLYDSAIAWLERAWRGRFKTSRDIDPDTWHTKESLDWHKTTDTVLALKGRIKGSIFDQIRYCFLTRAAEEIHKVAIENNLWGKDTEKYNVAFNALPLHMKDNYVLIALAHLVALSEQEGQKRS